MKSWDSQKIVFPRRHWILHRRDCVHQSQYFHCVLYRERLLPAWGETTPFAAYCILVILSLIVRNCQDAAKIAVILQDAETNRVLSQKKPEDPEVLNRVRVRRKLVLFLLRTRNLAYITAINKKITSYSGLDEVGWSSQALFLRSNSQFPCHCWSSIPHHICIIYIYYIMIYIYIYKYIDKYVFNILYILYIYYIYIKQKHVSWHWY